MLEQLERILDYINTWLKFAEAKNAMIIALNGAAIFNAIHLLELTRIASTTYLKIYIAIFCFLAFLALLTSLASFIPKTNLDDLFGFEVTPSKNNLLFFGNLAKYSTDSLISELSGSMALSDYTPNSIEKDYAEQIIINSKIAMKKYNYFKLAVWLTIYGLITPFIGFLVSSILYTNFRKKYFLAVINCLNIIKKLFLKIKNRISAA